MNLFIDRVLMRSFSFPSSRATFRQTQEDRPPEQPGEGRRTAQQGQDEPKSKQVADVEDDPEQCSSLRRR
ncbi:hypothetical protein [Cupriavidus pauculus]|uniref:hypothetical protein n=1 Tax=Cupriavidus pauculus TaxID=82633 RepID=UPI0011AF63C4|nr:hypothetical protein [Cupriavidus pauculus]